MRKYNTLYLVRCCFCNKNIAYLGYEDGARKQAQESAEAINIKPQGNKEMQRRVLRTKSHSII